MVKDVERFSAEVDVHSVCEFECLVDRHIKLGTMRDIEAVASGVAEGQALRFRVSVGIE